MSCQESFVYLDDCGHHGRKHGHHGHLHGCEADFIRKIPVLRFLKEPVQELNDLYRAYPLGGQPGWYSFVFNEKTFAFWHHGKNRWELMRSVFTKEDFFNCFGIDMRHLKDSQVLLWDKEAGTFRLFVIRTVTAIPHAKDDDGLYLVEGIGVYVVDGNSVREIAKSGEQSDWNENDSTKMSFIRHKPTIPTIPPIPTVNNSLVILKQAGVEKGRFSLNQANGDTIEFDSGVSDDSNVWFTVYHNGLDFNSAPNSNG